MPAYLAVASNTSGSTPKELFEDVVEELEKQVSMLNCLYSWCLNHPSVFLFFPHKNKFSKVVLIEALGSNLNFNLL
jgi:hypothetical protein